jgi:hypothetical protein
VSASRETRDLRDVYIFDCSLEIQFSTGADPITTTTAVATTEATKDRQNTPSALQSKVHRATDRDDDLGQE